MKPKDKPKANFLYSKPLRAKKLDLFCHNNIRVDENLDICDQISSILDDGDTAQKLEENNFDSHNHASSVDEQNASSNPSESFCKDENHSIEDTGDGAARVLCSNEPEKNKESVRDEAVKPEPRSSETQKASEASKSTEVHRFSYKLPTLKNLFQPPYAIRKPSFLTKSVDARGEAEKNGHADCLSNEEFEKKAIHLLPAIIQRLCDENANFKLLSQNQEVEIERLVVKRESLSKRIEECETEKGNIMAELKKLNSEYSKLVEDMEQNDAYKKEIESYLVILKEEHENMRSKQSEINESNKKLQEEKSRLETRILKHEKEAALFTEKNSQLEDMLKTHAARLACLEDEKAALESQVSTFEKDLSTAVSRCNAVLEHLQGRVGSFGRESAKRMATIKNLVLENDQATRSAAELKEQMRVCEDGNRAMRATIEQSCCKSKRASSLVKDLASEVELTRTCAAELDEGVKQLEHQYKKKLDALNFVKSRGDRMSSLLKVAKDKLGGQVAPELRSMQQNMRQIKKCIQKAWSRETLERARMREAQNDEIQKLKIHYTMKIRKIYKHYKDRRQKTAEAQEEPDDEDVWNVFQ